MGPRREPERTCIGCRGRAPKRELLRLVPATDGVPRVDPSGGAAGRGAYVHRDMGCVSLAIRRGSIGRALRIGLDADGAARLMADIEREVGP